MPIKKKCEKCSKIYRTRCLRKNKINGELWCNHCLHKYGEHKLYPQGIITKENLFVSKYGISTEEKKHLFNNLIRNGLSPRQANQRIFFDIKMLKQNKRRNRYLAIGCAVEKKKQIETNEKFLEGLGQLK